MGPYLHVLALPRADREDLAPIGRNLTRKEIAREIGLSGE